MYQWDSFTKDTMFGLMICVYAMLEKELNGEH